MNVVYLYQMTRFIIQLCAAVRQLRVKTGDHFVASDVRIYIQILSKICYLCVSCTENTPNYSNIMRGVMV